MKRKNWKKRLSRTLANNSKPIFVAMLVIATGVALIYKRPVQAASDRAKTAAGILVGGGTGGLIAGLAGSAKWIPLGFGIGGLAGGLIARRIRKSKQRRAALAAQYGNQNMRTHYKQRHHTRTLRPMTDSNIGTNIRQSSGSYYQ